MKTLITLLCCLTAFIPAQAGKPKNLPAEVVASFKTATKFVLFSLEPIQDRDEKDRWQKLKPDEDHHGYKILGSIELTDLSSREATISTITNAVRDFDGELARCFMPRHSLRTVMNDGTTYDLVSCFQCDQIYAYRGAERIGFVGITGSQKPLDAILSKAKVKLSKPQSSE